MSFLQVLRINHAPAAAGTTRSFGKLRNVVGWHDRVPRRSPGPFIRQCASSSLTFALCCIITCFAATADARVSQNPEFVGDVPTRMPLGCDAPLARDAIRFFMTEIKRLSNVYRYVSLEACHDAEVGQATFGGQNVFLDLELDLLRGQLSRHDIIVFKDEMGVVNGMAIDAFPNVEFRPAPDPDV